MAAPVLGAILLLTGCAEQPKDPAVQAREDAKAVAMVEAAQSAKPPPTPMAPQPITAADIKANRFYGAGCSLVPAGQPGGNPIVIANDRRAVLKVGGKFVTFAADSGSALLAMGTRSRYIGKAQSLDLNRSPSDGTRLGQEASRWSAGMVVRDPWGQMIYSSGGELICGS
ncbi:MAG: hypothetical protein V4579_08395 [Pseudomonadota bacterium]